MTSKNCCVCERNWVGGLGKGHPPKKGLPPPACLALINYITCLAVLLPWCVTALLITYYNTSNNPFNTLVSVYITFDSILFQYSN